MKMRMFGMAAAVAMATALCVASPARATTYDFTFDGANIDVVGQFTTDLSNNVLLISGSVSGLASGAITSLVTSGSPFFAEPGHGWTYSNTYNPVSQIFNGDGVLFAFGAGNYGNIYNVGSTSYLSVFNPITLWNPGDVGTLSVHAVPGPIVGAGLPGLVIALGGLVALSRRRKKGAQALAV